MGSIGEIDTLLTSGLKTRIRSQQPGAKKPLRSSPKIPSQTTFTTTTNKQCQSQSQTLSVSSTFSKNLQEALDQRGSAHSLRCFVPGEFEDPGELALIDFSSNNILSWNHGPLLRDEFLSQLASHPNFTVGAGGTRLMDGNYTYLETVENEIAAFHGAETGLIMNSGYEANVSVWAAIPRPGDVMVHDTLVHSSTHEGMARSLSVHKVEFRHSDLGHYRKILEQVREDFPLVRQGKRTVLVAIEGVYSMDGDVCPLQEMVDIADEVFAKHKNVEFVMDEAHSSGLFGPGGAGIVSELGLQKRIAVRIHTFGKSVGASGAIVLGGPAIRAALINFNPSTIFSTAPSFPMVAAIKAGYNLITSDKGQAARDGLQKVARLFYGELTSHPSWPLALETGLLSVPLSGDDNDPSVADSPEGTPPTDWWENRPFLTHITTLHPRPEHLYWLYFHLLDAGFRIWAVEYPIVPLNKGRIKISLHAGNTDEQVVNLVAAIFDWVEEVHSLEEEEEEEKSTGRGAKGKGGAVKVTTSAKKVYDWMRSEGLDGFGMV